MSQLLLFSVLLFLFHHIGDDFKGAVYNIFQSLPKVPVYGFLAPQKTFAQNVLPVQESNHQHPSGDEKNTTASAGCTKVGQ